MRCKIELIYYRNSSSLALDLGLPRGFRLNFLFIARCKTRKRRKKKKSNHFLLFKHCADLELPANKQFPINPNYCGQYVSPDLYFLFLEVANNYNPTSLSEGPIESSFPLKPAS